MDSLPQELVHSISSFLDFDDLKRTLLVSRSFQFAAEHCSQAFRTFNLTPDNTEKFISTYSGHRLQYLQKVVFESSFPALKLPPYWKDLASEDGDDASVHSEGSFENTENEYRENKDDLDARDKDFTGQINVLFSALKTLDSFGTGHIHLHIFTPTLQVATESWGPQRAFVSWRVHLLSPNSLPIVACVQRLTIERPNPAHPAESPFGASLRKLDTRVLLDIARKLPNLEAVWCMTGGDEWHTSYQRDQAIYRYIMQDWKGPRRDSRHDFAKALDITELPRLRHAHLDFLYPLNEVENIDQRWAATDLSAPATHDPFSATLRLLSCHLRSMYVRVVADETLFWPVSDGEPTWPMLQTLHVMFHMSTPSGSWYFKEPPGTRSPPNRPERHATGDYPPLADTEKDVEFGNQVHEMGLRWDDMERPHAFRVQPNEDTLVPFLAAFAKAAANMPALKTFAIWSPLLYRPDSDSDDELDYESESDFDEISTLIVERSNNVQLAWGIAYMKPLEIAFATEPGEDCFPNRQMWWRVGRWQPTPDLHRAFRRIGCEAYGDALAEYRDNHGLSERWDFVAHGESVSQRKPLERYAPYCPPVVIRESPPMDEDALRVHEATVRMADWFDNW
jgi:hypothetical protein